MSLRDVLSHYTPRDVVRADGDIHVAINGNDANDGSMGRPFATLERARDAARALKADGRAVTVCVHAGEYHTQGFYLTKEDSGCAGGRVTYRAYGDGEVILNSAISLKGEDFQPIGEDIRSRLRGDAAKNVVCVDLKQYGMTKSDWGALCPIGAFGTETKYDDCVLGENCELFCNGQRMTLARYPSEGFLELAAVADIGDVAEFPEQNYYWDWKDRRNHRGGTYIMDKQTTARVATWKDTKNVWAYGYFYHDWADSSTPIRSFDVAHRSFQPAYVCRYGAKKGAIYFFYNVLDELAQPGQWYLDREQGILYVYPQNEIAQTVIEMNFHRNSVLTAEDVRYVTIEGLTIKGACADGVTWNGSDCVLSRLNIHGVTGNGMIVTGCRNLVSECEVYDAGRGCIIAEGGERETLTHGENVVDNCLLHDWGKVSQMYAAGVHLKGVGNTCSHNEMYNAPHTAIFYYGNDHVIEYNYIHDVVKQSSDAGAIYSGQDWTRQGCIVRYNCLNNIGGGRFTPDGIYFDDMLSGQTAYGNLVIGAKKNGFLVGGGRDNFVYNNMLVDCGYGITYDDRARDGFFNNGWAIASVINYETGCMWQRLREAPYQSEIWAKKYPSLAKISHDFDNPEDAEFAVNPAHGAVHDNVVISAENKAYRIVPSVEQYSRVERNAIYASREEAGLREDYTLAEDSPVWKDLRFERIPLEKIGRY